ncbi:MAG: hypothetical protein QM346_08235 [Chloroflexota bacterium]|nr:hypothetical protein [Chloroflexota bacterium]
MQIPKGAKLITAFLIVGFSVAVLVNGWISDDAYITFRTVDHLVEGRGAVWNLGERVQAYTHPLWMLLVSAAVLVTKEYFLTVIALSAALSIVTAILVGYCTTNQPVSAWAAFVILLLSPSFLDYSTSGLENAASHLLLAGFLVLYVHGPNHQHSDSRWLYWLALLASLGAVNRLDTLLIYVPMLAAAWRQTRRWTNIAPLVVGFIPLAVWELFSLFYYGFPFPNTAYAKLDTGIPRGELIQQGVQYLLECAALDPTGATAIVAGTVAAFWLGKRRYQWASASILLYLVYIIYIGGDFMAGRFLTPLLLLSAVMLAVVLDDVRLEYRYTGVGFFVFVGLAALIATTATDGDAATPAGPSSHGIADERAIYSTENSLLSVNSHDRLIRSGRLQGTVKEDPIVDCGGVGIRSFQASPYTRVVDTCGLSDALLARLPAKRTPDWRIGHFRRTIPDGYLQTLASGENAIADPHLAQLYDSLTLVTQGDLFAPMRLTEIWRLNTGAYDSLIDRERYRHPDAVRIPLADAMQGIEQPLTSSGVYVDATEPVHPSFIELVLNCDTLELAYATAEGGSLQQNVRTPALHFADAERLWVSVPLKVSNQGVESLHVLPDFCAEPVLYNVVIVDNVTEMPLIDALDLADWTAYRAQGRERDVLLAQLKERIGEADAAEWDALSVSVVLDVLRLPDDSLREIVHPKLPNDGIIVDVDGVPTLRYLGAIADPEDDGVELDFYFEAMQPSVPSYTVELKPISGDVADSVTLQPEVDTADGLHKASVDLPMHADEIEAELCIAAPDGASPLLFQSNGNACTPLKVD